jgi:hypothetical protein
MPTKKVTTATLIRGSIYALRHPDNSPQSPVDSLRFENGIPVVIDDPAIAKTLEELYVETVDGDHEHFEKPVFRIDRNVPHPDAEAGPSRKKKPTRLSSTRTVRKRSRSA